MKTLKKTTAAILICLMALGSLQGVSVRAASFPADVPSTHWAFHSIERVTSLGLMTGMTAGDNARFGVNEMVGMWETVRILAQLAGFRRTDATYEERMFQEMCYHAHIDTINFYAADFVHWRSQYNMELAYLLELRVLLPPELEEIMGIDTATNSESEFALIRENVVLFLVRLMGVDDVARNYVPATLFADNHDINILIQPYVYYLRHLGIISGDGNNNFNPRAPVTRAAMATMIDLVANFINFDGRAPQGNLHANQGGENVFAAEMGEITNLFSSPGFRAVELRNRLTGERGIFPMGSGASIIVNQAHGMFEQFQIGMDAAVILANGEITDIIAFSQQAPPQHTPPPPHTPHPTYPPHPTPTPAPGIGTGIFSDAVVEGTVRGSRQGADGWFIDLEITLLNSFGELTLATQTFRVSPAVDMLRGSAPILFPDISFGDLASVTISGGYVRRILLQERMRNLSGTVVSKRAVEGTRQGVISVRDAADRIHELVTTDATVISRLGHLGGTPDWNDVRVGDRADIHAEFNQIISLSATGTRRHADIMVTGINITVAGSYITGIHEGREETFPVIPGVGVNPYQLRVGNMVRLTLDSMEIDNILVLTGEQPQHMTANIQAVQANMISVQNAVNHADVRVLTFAEGMIVRGIAGQMLTPAALNRNMRVHIVYANFGGAYFATEITIISN